jgi:transposase
MHIATIKTKNLKTGKIYINHKLVQTIRTEKGPRNRIVMSLGKLDLSKDDLKKLAFVLEGRITGQASLFEEEEHIVQIADEAMAHFDFNSLIKIEKENQKPKDSVAVPVFIEKTTVSETRSLGPELVGHQIWQELKLDSLLEQCGFNKYQRCLAEAVVIARLVEPGSERQTHEWIKKQTALTEFLAIDPIKVGKNQVYTIADQLLAQKEIIEKSLRETELNLFSMNQTLFLYDLTNTYFEGSCVNNSLGKRGRSKEKRSDCPLVTLALLVDQRGFPIFSQIYRGNQSEPQTLEEILNRLEKDCGKAGNLFFKPTIVMDRGIAVQNNLKMLQEKQYHYVVIERRQAEKEYREEFEQAREQFELVKTGTGNHVYLKKLANDQGTRVLVFSEEKKYKEESIDKLQEERLLEDLARLQKSVLKRNIVLAPKVAQRIGRLLERYPKVAKYYEIDSISGDSENEIQDITWRKKPLREERSILTGCYVIETNHKNLSACEIWEIYHTLTHVEYAFRCLKTDLGMRPIHHQLLAVLKRIYLYRYWLITCSLVSKPGCGSRGIHANGRLLRRFLLPIPGIL